jgi:DNA-binding transcriptional LysR family regulator
MTYLDHCVLLVTEVEIRQLRYFVTLAEELHFRRAAERMHIAQPAFSGHIRRLEGSVGVQLFDRTSHYVRLTEAGRLFLDEVRLALAQIERAAAVAAQAGRGELGRITVGFIGSAANELTPPILRTFAARYPTVNVSMQEFDFRDPTAGLTGGDVDVAFMRPPVEGQADLVVEPLFEEPRLAIMASDHRLAREPALTIGQLLHEPFVVGPRATGVWRDAWLAMDHRNGTPPRLGPEATTVHEWLHILAAGGGVSLAPASSERFYSRPGVRFVPVTDIAGSTVAIARRSGPTSPAVSAFVGVSREIALSSVNHW